MINSEIILLNENHATLGRITRLTSFTTLDTRLNIQIVNETRLLSKYMKRLNYSFLLSEISIVGDDMFSVQCE